jgi:hypothetical protein
MSSCPCQNTHANTLACERCCEAHVGFAAVLAQECAEDGARLVERRLCLGNLKAAEWHARALGRPDLAAKVREARHRFADGDTGAVAALLGVEIARAPAPSTPSTTSTSSTPSTPSTPSTEF